MFEHVAAKRIVRVYEEARLFEQRREPEGRRTGGGFFGLPFLPRQDNEVAARLTFRLVGAKGNWLPGHPRRFCFESIRRNARWLLRPTCYRPNAFLTSTADGKPAAMMLPLLLMLYLISLSHPLQLPPESTDRRNEFLLKQYPSRGK
jgi:hypothetical protein